MSGYEHIQPKFRHLLEGSDEKRIRFLDEPRWIGYPIADYAIDTLRALMEKPRKPRMPNLLIVGDSNNGKTSILERFSSLYGESYIDSNGEPVRPVLVVQAPPGPSEKDLYIAILERFFAPYRPTHTAAKLRYQVIHLLSHCQTKVLVIDEFHSFLGGTAIKTREVMNVLKFICNELRIPIVGVGTKDAARVLESDPQHSSRFDILELPLWKKDRDYQRLLAGFERALPLRKPSMLHDREKLVALHDISEGNLGNLHRLLAACAEEAIKNGKETIDMEIIDSNSWIRPTKSARYLRV